MGHRPSVQEALDALEKSGVHVWRWSGVGSYEEKQDDNNSVSGEVVLDFMFWPSKRHRFGWYLEPGYEHNFGLGHEQSLGMNGGLLIAIP